MKKLSILTLLLSGFIVVNAQTKTTTPQNKTSTGKPAAVVKPVAKAEEQEAVKKVPLVAKPAAENAHIYSPEADAKADLKAAVARAAKANKHVFVQVGGNWCSWCIAFHDMVNRTADLKKYLNDNYEVALINYSKDNKNLPLLAQLGYPQRFGFPVFLILDANGNVLHIENSAYLETTEKDENGKPKVGHDPKKVMAFLKNWTAGALDPKQYSK